MWFMPWWARVRSRALRLWARVRSRALGRGRVGGRIRARWFAPWTGLALLACESVPERAVQERDAGLGSSVARVDQETISLDELRSFCEVTGSSPREALDRLIGERLLAAYAQRRGYGELPSVRNGVERARVRALLAREIEGPGAPEELAQRRDKLEHWLAALAQGAPVRYDEAAIQKAFAQGEP